MDLEKIQEHRDRLKTQAEENKHKQEVASQVGATIKGASHIAKTIVTEAEKTRSSTQKVRVTNPPRVEVKHTIDFKPLITKLSEVKSAVDKVAKDIIIPKNEKVDKVTVSNLNDYSKQITELIKSVKAIDVKPQVNVSAPEIRIPENKVDFTPLNKKLDEVVKYLRSFKVEKTDFSKLETATNAVKTAINSLSFPVPNYVLPYTKNGSATQATIRGVGVRDAVDVAIVDDSGNQITSFGGGVQYTEGDTDATITGTATMVEGAANALDVMTQPLTDTQLRATPVPVSGSVSVSATDLDIRNLTNTDVVTAELSAVDNAVLDTIAAKDFATQTTLAAMNAKFVTGTDIGDVTINNASGASAVNIQDGGNSITVDTTSIADLDLGGGTANRESRGVTLANFTTPTYIADASAFGDDQTEGLAAVGTAWYTGSTWVRPRGSIADGLLVNLGSNNDVTVTGTVTANLSATDNAVLDQIELNQDSQTAILTTIDADTGAIKTAVETLDNAISGSEMQVDVVGSLPAGTNAIGKLSSNSGVDIGDVTLNNTLGAGTSDASTVRTTESTGETGTLSNVSASASSVTVLAANTSRREAILYNDSTSDAYLKFGSTASSTSFTFKWNSYDTIIVDKYNGIITAIWDSATGTARVTEVS